MSRATPAPTPSSDQRSRNGHLVRILIAVLFLLSSLGLAALDLSADDEALAWVLVTLPPFLVGALIGRWWALALSLSPVLFYVVDRDTGELAAWFSITFGVLFYLALIAAGVGAGRAVRTSLARRAKS